MTIIRVYLVIVQMHFTSDEKNEVFIGIDPG